MGRTPPRARRRYPTLAAALLTSLTFLLLLPATVAGGKKPGAPPGQQHAPGAAAERQGGGNTQGAPGAGGNSGGNAKAGGNGNGARGNDSGGGKGETQGSSSGNTGSNGNGNNGNANGNAGPGGGGPGGDSGGGADNDGGSGGSGSGGSAGGGDKGPPEPDPEPTPQPRTENPPVESPAGGGDNAQPTPRAGAPSPSAGGPRSRSGSPRSSRRDAGSGRRGSARSTRRARTRAGRSAGSRASTSAPEPVSRFRGASEPSAQITPDGRDEEPSTVVRTFTQVVEVLPGFVKALIAVLGTLLLIACVAWFLLARTARYLRRQREGLLREIGVLQGALLPDVPAELSRLEASVAYRPAEGLAAGGDFYDAFPLDGGRVGIVVGDIAGHGKEALMQTSLLRYTMRAYLEADLEPRMALQVAGRSLDRGFDTLATVVLAVYDPSRHVLRYASAGHPPPVFLGDADHVPVTRASSPPIGAGLPTGLRQTTVSLTAGSAVCFFTDGLIEARRGDDLVGRLGLVEIIRELGPGATAREVLERVAATSDQVTDDMAACMFRVADGPDEPRAPRVEELEIKEDEPLEPTLRRFLAACEVGEGDIVRVVAPAHRTLRQFGALVLRVSFRPAGPFVEVKPANVESLAWAYSRRARLAAGS